MNRFLAVAVLLAACGDDPMNKPDAAVTQQDAPNPPPPPPPDAAPDALPGVREGLVILAELKGADPDASAAASFQNSLLFGGPSGTAAGCDYYPNPNESGISAGVITVTGGAQTLTLTPSTTTPIDYSSGTIPDEIFDPGDTLAISAAGASVPAFNGTVVAPAEIANPVLPTAISRANPPTITWTAGTSSGMWLWVFGVSGSSGNLVWCKIPDNGSFAIPAAAVAQIPTANTSALVFLWRTNVSTVNAGGYNVSLVASQAVGTSIIALQP